MKKLKYSIPFLCVSLLVACNGDSQLLSMKETPDYQVTQSEEKPVEQKPFLNNILNQEDQEISNQNSNPPAVSPTAEVATKQGNDKERVTVTVKHIRDGDTIEYFDPQLGKVVTGRFLGINGPEIKEKQVFSKEATDFLTDLILGKEIQIEYDPNADLTDRYGRYLIHAFIGGKSIQSILLMEGLVRVAYLYGEYNYIDIYKEAENQAKTSGLNIWSIPGYVDSKNGFNMDVITENIEVNIVDKVSEFLSDKIK